MRMITRVYKYRIYPNEEQKIMFEKTFGCVRFIYNKMIEDKVKYYEETGKLLNNTSTQYKEKYSFLKEVDSQALIYESGYVLRDYTAFLKKKKPLRFKRKKYSQSYSTTYSKTSGFIENNYIRLRKVGYVKIKYHHPIPNNFTLKSLRITRTNTNKYYVYLRAVTEENLPQTNLSKDKALGLDYSSSYFYVDNQGKKANYPKFYRKSEKIITKEQRKLSRMEKGSKNYEKQRIKFAKKHEHIVNQRKDWLHKLSAELADQYDVVCVENLDLIKISKQYNLSKSTHDNSYGAFIRYLKYKLEDRGKAFIQIDRWFASSKMCHVCHNINSELKLGDKTWTCSYCNTTHNRDINAAINILNEGIKFV